MAYNFRIGDSRVLESRESSDGVTIRRRRETSDGKHRFTTYERIERPTLVILKRDDTREAFDRDKLLSSTQRSVGKFIKPDDIEEIIDAVEDRVYGKGEPEVKSVEVGEIVLDELGKRNEVAYVRFASVFHKFATLDDFVRILEQRKRQD